MSGNLSNTEAWAAALRSGRVQRPWGAPSAAKPKSAIKAQLYGYYTFIYDGVEKNGRCVAIQKSFDGNTAVTMKIGSKRWLIPEHLLLKPGPPLEYEDLAGEVPVVKHSRFKRRSSGMLRDTTVETWSEGTD